MNSAKGTYNTSVVVRIAGDSGDGIQLASQRLAHTAAEHGHGLATLPTFPAEIRAPAGTPAGVSAMQLRIAPSDVETSGDIPDVLVALNPAALRAHVGDLRDGGMLVVDSDAFHDKTLGRAGYSNDPLNDGSLKAYDIKDVPLARLASELAKSTQATRKQGQRSRNFIAIGLLCWMYALPLTHLSRDIARKFSHDPVVRELNDSALHAGWNFGETTEGFTVTSVATNQQRQSGWYRSVNGSQAFAFGLTVAAERAGVDLVLGAYPITPASDILHELSRMKELGVIAFQAEDEIAAAGAALGASYGGALGVTATSGPGMCLKSETIGLAVALELPLVVIDVQRAGPSTGMPTKVEQADLLQAMYGRNGESPVPVLAAASPADCFTTALEASRIALERRTPVIVLSDATLAQSSVSWPVPDISAIPPILPKVEPHSVNAELHLPYQRDPKTLARNWALPGTVGLQHRIGGLEKQEQTGDVCYDPDNHQAMVRQRQDKVDRTRELCAPTQVEHSSTRRGTLVLSWGSSVGPTYEAVNELRSRGHDFAYASVRCLHPLPHELINAAHAYDDIVVSELNTGHLASLLASHVNTALHRINKVAGTPFKISELVTQLTAHLTQESTQ